MQTKTQSLVFLKRLCLLLAAYTFSRLLFLVFNFSLFSFNGITETAKCFFFGIRFDLYAIAITNSLFVILHFIPGNFFYSKGWQIFLKIIFFLINIPCLLFNFIDIGYYRFTLKRTTADFFQFVTVGNDLKNTLPKILSDFWYLLLLLIILIFAINIFYKKTFQIPIAIETNFKFQVSSFKDWFLLPVVIFLLVIAGRGGFQYKPLSILTAAQYTSTQNVALVLNTPFTIIKSIGKENLVEENYFTNNELKNNYSPIHDYSSPEGFKPLNVVMIIMESFSKEYIGYFNNGQGYTPFLDSLMHESFVCTNACANGKRSIEGIPAVTAGILALSSNPYITSAYNANKINSLPLLLKEKGYSSAFFHGGNNGTMGFDNFSKMAGYEKYFGRNEFPGNDYDGNWGIYDEEFFQFFCSEMTKMKQPFVTTFFSLSSHHPYSLPEKYKNTFAEGRLPIHKTIRYADFALRKFFESAKQQSWFGNTIFVITADHTGPSGNSNYQNKKGMYSVPIAYYFHRENLKGVFENITQQCDIVPSVLNELHYEKPFKFYGESVFDSSARHYAATFIDDVYQLITDSTLLQFDGEKIIGFYKYRNDELLKTNLANANKTSLPEEKKLKAIIQDYNHSMIYNELTKTK